MRQKCSICHTAYDSHYVKGLDSGSRIKECCKCGYSGEDYEQSMIKEEYSSVTWGSYIADINYDGCSELDYGVNSYYLDKYERQSS